VSGVQMQMQMQMEVPDVTLRLDDVHLGLGIGQS
jgi:hypothetical protein